MKTNRSFILLIFIHLALLSCSEKKGPYFEEILNSKNGNLRDVKIGSTIEEVKPKENIEVLVDDVYDYLHYDYELDMGNSYTVTYDFSEENALYEIEISVYIDKIDEAKTLSKNFTDFFNKKYGKNQLDEDGYNTWNKSSANENIKFSLKEESGQYGFVSIKARDLNFLN